MIIDTEEDTLTISLARQMLAALIHFPGITERTEIEFNYYSNSGWTVSVIKGDGDDEPPKIASIHTPNTTLPYILTNEPKPDFRVYAETK